MGMDPSRQANRDQCSPAQMEETSLTINSSQRKPRHILPKDLTDALKHLDDQELDRLLALTLAEASRRGRLASSNQTIRRTLHRRQNEAETVSLTRGQINAVRAAIKAGVKPALIAREFGLSQSDIRKVLATDTAERGAID